MITKEFKDLGKIPSNANHNILKNFLHNIAFARSYGTYNNEEWIDKKVEDKENIEFWYLGLSSDKKFNFNNENKQKIEVVSSECFSLLCFTFAINHFLFTIYEDEENNELQKELTELYYLVIKNVNLILDEDELEIFNSIID
ncbi:hypothetical protein [Aliarcobacter butzleri]|uniref:hypothetical protein n=1 Tax=Aliarcobacter butzleri TaxID=28197 RepID=UPI00344CED63